MKKRRFFAGFAAAAIAASVMAVPVGAVSAPAPANSNNYSAATTSLTMQFDKNLTMDSDANIPGATFSFTVSHSDSMAKVATSETYEVLEGIGEPTIADVVFTAGATDTTDTSMTITTSGDTKTATKKATIDFSRIEFKEPGVYRYLVTESASTANSSHGIVNDTKDKRTLDVFVVDNGGTLEVTKYVLYSGEITSAPSLNGTTANSGDGKKSNGYTNTYTTVDLSVGKKIEGNQASKDKYFAITVNIENAVAGTVYDVDLTHAHTTEISNDVNAATTGITGSVTNASKLTAGSDGKASGTFYLQGDEYVIIKGIAKSSTYSVAEADYSSEGYVSSEVTDAATFEIDGVTFDDGVRGTIDAEDLTTGFKNSKSGTIPTGVILSIAAPAVVGVGVLSLIITLNVKKKREEAEE